MMNFGGITHITENPEGHVERHRTEGQQAAIDLFGKLIKQHGISQHAIKTIIAEFRAQSAVARD